MNKTIEFKQAKISYSIEGKGKTVVLIHGFLESGKIYDNIIKEIRATNQVICINLPGHGTSEDCKENYDMLHLGQLIKLILEEEHISTCKIIGHSLGAYVALAFLEQYSTTLEGICIFHSTTNDDDTEKKNNRNKAIALVEKDKGAFLSVFIPNLFTAQNRAKYTEKIRRLIQISQQVSDTSLIQTIKAMRDRKDSRSLLKEFQGKKLYIIGKEDPVLPSTELVAQAQETQSQYIVLENVGHMGFIEDEKGSLKTIQDFLK